MVNTAITKLNQITSLNEIIFMAAPMGKAVSIPRALGQKLISHLPKALQDRITRWMSSKTATAVATKAPKYKRLKRDKEQWKRFDDLLRNPGKTKWTKKQKLATTIAGVVGADLLIDREDLENMPWPIQKAADEAIELKTKVEQATVEAGRKMKSWGLSLFENPEEHALT